VEAGQPRQLGQLREILLTDGWGHRLEAHLEEDSEPVEVQQEVQQRQAAKDAVGGLRWGWPLLAQHTCHEAAAVQLPLSAPVPVKLRLLAPERASLDAGAQEVAAKQEAKEQRELERRQARQLKESSGAGAGAAAGQQRRGMSTLRASSSGSSSEAAGDGGSSKRPARKGRAAAGAAATELDGGQRQQDAAAAATSAAAAATAVDAAAKPKHSRKGRGSAAEQELVAA
jgi:hypothetical protein